MTMTMTRHPFFLLVVGVLLSYPPAGTGYEIEVTREGSATTNGNAYSSAVDTWTEGDVSVGPDPINVQMTYPASYALFTLETFAQTLSPDSFSRASQDVSITVTNPDPDPRVFEMLVTINHSRDGDADSGSFFDAICDPTLEGCMGTVTATNDNFDGLIPEGSFTVHNQSGGFLSPRGWQVRDANAALHDGANANVPVLFLYYTILLNGFGNFYFDLSIFAQSFASSAQTTATIEITVVPIPPALLLFAGALVPLATWRRRRH